MDLSYADEACSSAVTVTARRAVLKEEREEVVEALKLALASRGLGVESQLLWFATYSEAELFKKSEGSLDIYKACVREKLLDIREYSRHGSMHGLGSWPAPACAAKNDADTFSAACVADEGRPATGYGISEDAWKQVQTLRGTFFVPLQAVYSAIVASLMKNPNLKQDDRKLLITFKRLVLGLVVFLAADRNKIPSKFGEEKLVRLEKEVVHIMAVVLQKTSVGILRLPAPIVARLTIALRKFHRTHVATVSGAACTSSKVKSEAAELLGDLRSRVPVSGQPSALGKRKTADKEEVQEEVSCLTASVGSRKRPSSSEGSASLESGPCLGVSVKREVPDSLERSLSNRL